MVSMVNLYVLIDPRDNEIRYVGKTTQTLDGRLRGHITDARKSTNLRARWIAKLMRLGYRPRIEIIQTVPEQGWRQAEWYWIAYYRTIGCRLTNGTEGGDGGDSHMPEVRAKISRANKGKQTRLGSVMSAESRAKSSKSQTGKKASPETRAKQSASHKGLRRTDEQRANMSGPGNPFYGRKHSDETKALQSAIRSARHKTHCVNGHEFTPANTKWEGNSQRCIECRRAGQRRRVLAKSQIKI